MSVEPHLLPTHSEAIFNAMQAERTVTRIAFNPSTANPSDVLYVTVPKLTQDVVMVPGSLSLLFDIDLTGGHANNYLVQNVSRALVSRLTVTFGSTLFKIQMGMTSTKTSMICSYPLTSVTRCLWRGSRV